MLRYVRSSHLFEAFPFRLSALLNVFAGLFLLGVASPLWSQVTTTQAAVNFSVWVPVGAATGSTQTLTFTVSGTTTLGGVSVLTLGAPSLDYTVVAGGTTCANGTTAPTACTVQVKFLPTAPGPRIGAVVLTDQSIPPNTLIIVPLSGTGTGPMVAFGPGTIATLAGTGAGGYSGDNTAATGAELNYPSSVALDGAGNLYLADVDNNRIRKVTPGGTITTVAGTGAAGYNGDNITAITAKLADPFGVAVDGAGNLYIADYFNSRIRKMTASTGIITTVAGTGTSGYNGDNIAATSAELNLPAGVAVDGAGNLYIADVGNNRIRKVTPDGTITTVAGTGTSGYNGDNIAATGAKLSNPHGIAVDGTGNFYIADFGNSRIRKVTPGGTITTVAGTGTSGYDGDNIAATSAELYYPAGVALDGAGNLYIADFGNSRIRKVTPDGFITTVAGTGTGGYNGDNIAPASAELFNPFGIAVDGAGNLYIADTNNNRVRKVDVSDAPSLTFASTKDGEASASQDVTVLNLGNALLTISQISTAANFSLGGSDTSCSSSSQLLDPAFSCVLGVEFNPAVGGSISGSVILTDNALNATAATQSIALQGTGIPPAATTMLLTPTPASAALGGAVALTATISSTTAGTITGTVTFLKGSTILGTAPVLFTGSVYQATLSNAAVTTANGFSAGTNTVTASYSGDLNYASSTGSTPLTIAGVAAVTTTTVGVSANPAALGGAIAVTASVGSATAGVITGTVTFSLGSTILGTAPVSSGQATLSCVTVSAANGFIGGTNTITATYSGNPNYAASTGSTTLTVTGVANPTTTTLAASPSSLMLGGTTTLTASVSSTTPGTLTGSVTFMEGSTTLGTVALSGGLATLSNASVTAAYGFWVGTDTVTAIYSGDANYAGSLSPGSTQGSTTLTVTSPPVTTTTLTAAPASVTLGATTELVAGVTSTAAGTIVGTVTFTVGTTTLGTATVSGGWATLYVTASAANGFSVGTDTITATYGGCANYATSSGTGTLTVLAATTTTLTAAPDWVTLAGTTELVASVTSTTAGTIAGTVTFTVGNTSLGTATVSGGLAILNNVAVSATNGFSTGTNTITATYSGNAIYGTSTVSTTMKVTGSAVTTTTLTAIPAWVTLAGTTELVASVTSTTAGTIAGSVTFSIGSTTLGTAAVSGGLATLSNVAVSAANGFIAGPNTITASYGGNANYAASIDSTTVTVTGSAVTATTLTAAPATVAPGGTTALTASVSSAIPGTLTGNVTFSMGGTNLGTVPVSGGLATLSNAVVSTANGFSVGWDTITATYGGNANYASSNGSTTLSVVGPAATTTTLTAAPASLTLGGATALVASVTSTTGGTIAGTVTFMAGSTTLGTATVSGGFATLNNVTVNAANGFIPGIDTVTASYGGCANFAASTGSTTLTVLAVTNTSLTAAPASVILGGVTELVASVSSSSGGTIAGTVTFSMGSTALGTAPVSGGLAILNAAVVTAANGFIAGTDTITATYGGSANFAASTGSTTLTVASPAATTTTVTGSPSSVALGGTTGLTASVTSTTAGTIGGTVTFSIGSTILGTAPVSGGLATLSKVAVSAANGFSTGTDTITASYGGGGIFAASIGSTTLTVAAPPATTTTLSATPSSVALGGTTGLTASVTSTTAGTIAGTVTFSMGSTTLGTASVSGGLATLSTVAVSTANGFSVGSDSITATYGGSANFAASTGSTTLTVVATPAYTMSASAATATVTAGSSANVTLSLTSLNNYAGTVSFSATSSAPLLVSATAPSVTLTSDGSGSSTLTISATTSAAKHAPARPWKSGGAVMLCAVLLGAPFGLRRKRAIAVLLTALAISLAGLLMACGGGSSTLKPAAAAAQTFTVTVTPTGTGTVTNAAPVSITVTVP